MALQFANSSLESPRQPPENSLPSFHEPISRTIIDAAQVSFRRRHRSNCYIFVLVGGAPYSHFRGSGEFDEICTSKFPHPHQILDANKRHLDAIYMSPA